MRSVDIAKGFKMGRACLYRLLGQAGRDGLNVLTDALRV
jgi:hypothetical protein